jgi:protein TonB
MSEPDALPLGEYLRLLMAMNPARTAAAVALITALAASTFAAADDEAQQPHVPSSPMTPRRLPPKAVPPDPAKPSIADFGAPNCHPMYTRASLLAEEQGTVGLLFKVSKEGKLTEASVTRSSGFLKLDQSALQGLSTCTFKPGIVDGRPVDGELRTEYVWKLE